MRKESGFIQNNGKETHRKEKTENLKRVYSILRDEALAEISNHIHKFWDPRMRRELLSQMDAGVTVDLLPIVVDAIAAHRSVLAV